MIRSEEPIPNLQSVTIDRQRLSGECMRDHQRNQLLWKLKGAVVVGAICNDGRQPVCVKPRSDEMIGRSLGGRIRAIRAVWRLLVKGRIALMRPPRLRPIISSERSFTHT